MFAECVIGHTARNPPLEVANDDVGNCCWSTYSSRQTHGFAEGLFGQRPGAIAISGALEKAGVPASLVEYVIMGQVLTAGAGQIPPARRRWPQGSAGMCRR